MKDLSDMMSGLLIENLWEIAEGCNAMLGIPVLSVQHLLVYAMVLKLFFQGKDDCLTMVQELIILEWTYLPEAENVEQLSFR